MAVFSPPLIKGHILNDPLSEYVRYKGLTIFSVWLLTSKMKPFESKYNLQSVLEVEELIVLQSCSLLAEKNKGHTKTIYDAILEL